MVKLLVALILAGGPLHAETGVTDQEIVIGSCTDLGSPSGAHGRMQIRGAQGYFDYVNQNGGIHGRKLQLISYDDRSDPELTVACFRRLITEDEIFIGGFFLNTPNAVKLVVMAESLKVPIVGIISGAQFIYEPVQHYVFNYQESVQDQIEGLIDNVWERLHFRRIAVIGQADATAMAGLTAAQKVLNKHGAAPVAFATYPRGTTDVEFAIRTVRAKNPDAVLLSAIGPPIREIVKRSHAAGWKPLFMTTTLDPIVNETEGTIVAMVLPPFADTKLPAVALYQRLMAKGYPGAQTGYAGLMGFMQAKLLVEGLNRAGKDLTREKYIQALESIQNFDIGFGPDIPVNLSRLDHKATHHTFYAVTRDGKAVPFTDWATLHLK